MDATYKLTTLQMPVYMWITKYGEGQGGNSNDLPKSS